MKNRYAAFIFLILVLLFFSCVDMKCDQSVSVQEEKFRAKQIELEKKLREKPKPPPAVYLKSQ